VRQQRCVSDADADARFAVAGASIPAQCATDARAELRRAPVLWFNAR